ncbi:excinuclease ABC subunit UvrC [Microbaculum marinisediminis]|uniref:UvrABC system protein C n=1 Tax=Microbaculum marinisediminis TaxID=2931392 RepID=A0AAW5QVK7_9HYPH|nr:excinuclease ABC subunit UvrC [Microbaculum sp. A6E488]MCT8971970.1 excinuclease ABC subunit UvrC [Microbaculum sp. A6E488]
MSADTNQPDTTETTDTTETPARTGPSVIAAMVRRLPNGPGVYRMLDRKGDVLYVGKARSLKKRVGNYARIGGQTQRIARMIAETAAMEFVSTQTETEALLLEANLIKRLRPRYNVLLRDDKSFPYILITRDHPAPQIVKHRGARNRKGDYFGPFASAGAVGRTINALQRAFLLRSCSDSVYESRTRPCLLYQIKRCAAPCTAEISLEDYAVLVKEAEAFLSGKSRAVREDLAHQMEAAAERLEFETAAVYRDRLAALSHVQAHQGINPQTVDEADVFAVHQDGGQTCIQVFFFRTGQNWGNRAYFPRADKSLDAAEVLGAFIAQFYDDKPVPRLILLSDEIEEMALLCEALSLNAGHKVEVAVPKRGEKRELVEHALSNAKEALGRRLAESASQARLLAGVAEAFGLDDAPRRVEVYDNSHIMGTNAVGGMVVAGPEGFEKGQYRKFNIKGADLTPGDDYAMMREVLTRRFKRLLKETGRAPGGGDAPDQAAPPHPEDGADAPVSTDDPGILDVVEDDDSPWPDLVLIDGGQGQLSAARAVMAELGLEDVPLVAIAKGLDRDAGREEFHIPGRQPFRLAPRDPVLYFVQRLRDEAHRFAIGSHRARRKKALAANPLDEIPGIGPTRKRALLRHFGSAKAVSRAGLADLEAAPGISAQMARQVYDFFHEGE